MRKKYWIISLASFCLTILLFSQSYLYYNSVASVSSSGHLINYLLDELEADIDGDNISDKISIWGKKAEENDEIATEINISVCFSKTGFTKKTNTNTFSGKNYQVKICDFTGDNKSEVMITIDNDKNDTLKTAIFDFSPSIPKNIFTEKDNEGVKLIMRYGNDFVLNASIYGNNDFSINLSKQSAKLISSGIYHANGVAASNNMPQISYYTELTPLPKSESGIYELYGKQKITGENKLTLCEVITYLKYENNKWNPRKIEYSFPST